MKKYFIIPSIISAFVIWTFGLADDENLRLIRLFAFAAAFWCAFGDPKNILSKRTSMKIVIPMLVVMLVYNPIFPVNLDDFDFYAGMNIVTGIALIWCAFNRAKLFSMPDINVDGISKKIREEHPCLHNQLEDYINKEAAGMAMSMWDLDEDSEQISKILGLETAKEDVKKYTKQLKGVYYITDDKSYARMSLSIKANAPVDISDDDCAKIYAVISGIREATPLYLGGDGSETSPVIINTTKSDTGIPAEYDWISKRHGQFQKDWKLKDRSTYTRDGIRFQLMIVETNTGSEVSYHFDISRFS